MAKRKIKLLKRLQRSWKYNGSRWLKLAIVFMVLALALFFGLWFDNEGTKEKTYDFEDRSVITSEADQYDAAMVLIDKGQLEEARQKLKVIAPLAEEGINKRGYAPAHLWLARDLLGSFNANFLYQFPVAYLEDGSSELPSNYISNERSKSAIRHLEHAIAIDGSIAEANVLLASLYLLENRRSDSVRVLVTAISYEENPQVELLLPMAVVMTYQGDALEIEENALLEIDRVRRDLSLRQRGNVSAQLLYLNYALILKNFKVVDIAARRLNTLTRSEILDGDKKTQIAASIDYWKALFDSKPDGVESPSKKLVVQYLAQALVKDKRNLVLIKSLTGLTASFPELISVCKNALSEMGVDASSADEVLPTEYYMLMEKLGANDQMPRKMYLERALENDPSDRSARFALANYYLSQSRPDFLNAKKLVGTTTDVSKLDADQQSLVGRLLIHEKQWEKAIVVLEQALPLTTKKKELHLMLSNAYAGVGKTEIAQLHAQLAAQD